MEGIRAPGLNRLIVLVVAVLGLAVTALGAAGATAGWLVVAGFFPALLLIVPWLGRVPRVAPARPAPGT